MTAIWTISTSFLCHTGFHKSFETILYLKWPRKNLRRFQQIFWHDIYRQRAHIEDRRMEDRLTCNDQDLFLRHVQFEPWNICCSLLLPTSQQPRAKTSQRKVHSAISQAWISWLEFVGHSYIRPLLNPHPVELNTMMLNYLCKEESLWRGTNTFNW